MNNAPGTETVMFVDLESTTLGVNDRARRHTAESHLPFYLGDIEAVVEIARLRAINVELLDDVLYVTVPPEGFFSGVVKLAAWVEIRAVFTARHKNKEPSIQVEAAAGSLKAPAKKVVLAFRSRKVLGRLASTNAAWELVNILASATEENEPPTPAEMARLSANNQTLFESKDWVRSVTYWNTYARLTR